MKKRVKREGREYNQLSLQADAKDKDQKKKTQFNMIKNRENFLKMTKMMLHSKTKNLKNKCQN